MTFKMLRLHVKTIVVCELKSINVKEQLSHVLASSRRPENVKMLGVALFKEREYVKSVESILDLFILFVLSERITIILF